MSAEINEIDHFDLVLHNACRDYLLYISDT